MDRACDHRHRVQTQSANTRGSNTRRWTKSQCGTMYSMNKGLSPMYQRVADRSLYPIHPVKRRAPFPMDIFRIDEFHMLLRGRGRPHPILKIKIRLGRFIRIHRSLPIQRQATISMIQDTCEITFVYFSTFSLSNTPVDCNLLYKYVILPCHPTNSPGARRGQSQGDSI